VEQLATFKGTERFEVKGCLGAGGMGIVYEGAARELFRRAKIALVNRVSKRIDLDEDEGDGDDDG